MRRSATWLLAVAIPAALTAPGPAFAQEKGDIRELKLRDWEPRSMLVTKVTEVARPAFPVVDVHNHLGGGKVSLNADRVRHYLEEMDAAGVRAVVNLDGGWGQRLKETLAALDEAHPGRFLTYALIDFSGIDEPGWSRREAARLTESFEAGAKGLKFHKTLGLGVRYKDGRFLPVDDPKLDPIWEVCAVQAAGRDPHGGPRRLLHAAGPAQRAVARAQRAPRVALPRQGLPRPLRAARAAEPGHRPPPGHDVHLPHMANDGEDLSEVGRWLDTYPNMYVNIDARISELGRQPYTARRFFLKYQDRIMFGTDTAPNRAAYRIYYRFLETDDEYFDPAGGHHRQGFWMIYGVFLPKDVLEKLYHKNAERLLVGLKKPDA